jgi:hypothetical protein
MNTAEIILATTDPLLPHHEAVVRMVGADPIIASLTGCPRWEAGGYHMARFGVSELADQPGDIRQYIHGISYTARWESLGVMCLEPLEYQVEDAAGIGVLNVLGEDHRDDCAGHGRLLLHRLKNRTQPTHG